MLQDAVLTCLMTMLNFYVISRKARPNLLNSLITPRFTFVMTVNRFSHNKSGESSLSFTSKSSSSSSFEESEISTLESSIDSCKNYHEISRLIAAYLIQKCKQSVKAPFYKGGMKLSLAVAGGGSSSISTLSSIAGSSNVLLQGNLLYHRSSFAKFVSSSLSNISHLPEIILQEGNTTKTFQFASSQASLLLAYSALHESIYSFSASPSYSSNALLQQLQHECLGVGCSSTLIRAHSGKLEVEGTLTTRALKSHAHISTWSADGSIYQYDITLCNQLKDEQIAESMTTSRRNRLEEEQVIGALILWAILRHRNCITYHSQAAPHKRIMEEDKVLQRILDRPGDTIAIRQFEQYFPHQKLLGDQEYWSSFSTTKYVTANIVPWQDKVEYIVNRILCKEVDTSILIPQRVTPSMIATNDMLSDTVLIEQRNHSTQFSIMGHTMLPHNVIIMPGSFNPLHQGHVSLANAAINALQINMEQSALRTDYSQSDLQNKDTVLDKVWNATIQRNQDMKWSILFEISLFNADKPPIESKEVIRRLETFTTYLRENETAAQLSSLDWGVLLSSSPLFLEKVEMLKKYLVGKPLSFMGQMPIRLVFVIGADTMVRIINPKYYQNSTGKMIDAVRRMREAGVHFIVGARLDQSVVVSNTDAPRKHVTGEDELECLPEDVRSLFTLLPGFRVDISSSEIRARKL